MPDSPLAHLPAHFPPLPARPPLPPVLARAIAVQLLAGVRKRFQTGTAPDGRRWKPLARPRVSGGALPLLDTGVLRNSYQTRVEADGASVGSVLPQARLHQFGGVVRAKRAKFLSLPLTLLAKRAGSPRRFPAELKFRPFGTGKPGGVLYQKAGGRPVDHYLLVPEVTVPARPVLGASAEDLRRIDQIAGEFGYQIAAYGVGVG